MASKTVVTTMNLNSAMPTNPAIPLRWEIGAAKLRRSIVPSKFNQELVKFIHGKLSYETIMNMDAISLVCSNIKLVNNSFGVEDVVEKSDDAPIVTNSEKLLDEPCKLIPVFENERFASQYAASKAIISGLSSSAMTFFKPTINLCNGRVTFTWPVDRLPKGCHGDHWFENVPCEHCETKVQNECQYNILKEEYMESGGCNPESPNFFEGFRLKLSPDEHVDTGIASNSDNSMSANATLVPSESSLSPETSLFLSDAETPVETGTSAATSEIGDLPALLGIKVTEDFFVRYDALDHLPDDPLTEPCVETYISGPAAQNKAEEPVNEFLNDLGNRPTIVFTGRLPPGLPIPKHIIPATQAAPDAQPGKTTVSAVTAASDLIPFGPCIRNLYNDQFTSDLHLFTTTQDPLTGKTDTVKHSLHMLCFRFVDSMKIGIASYFQNRVNGFQQPAILELRLSSSDKSVDSLSVQLALMSVYGGPVGFSNMPDTIEKARKELAVGNFLGLPNWSLAGVETLKRVLDNEGFAVIGPILKWMAEPRVFTPWSHADGIEVHPALNKFRGPYAGFTDTVAESVCTFMVQNIPMGFEFDHRARDRIMARLNSFDEQSNEKLNTNSIISDILVAMDRVYLRYILESPLLRVGDSLKAPSQAKPHFKFGDISPPQNATDKTSQNLFARNVISCREKLRKTVVRKISSEIDIRGKRSALRFLERFHADYSINLCETETVFMNFGKGQKPIYECQTDTVIVSRADLDARDALRQTCNLSDFGRETDSI